ncbi:hypothetical protein CSUB01_11277 [Colletotrichum sublineola]|uniref:Uncharacterized protein n=1 Tax=Colletotrichum sublineola TaxID=1173701 RepID=A0A066X1J9_COLSU|nr:hypothetical protein CSUB01_11277 [Colletotrichum sublineola]
MPLHSDNCSPVPCSTSLPVDCHPRHHFTALCFPTRILRLISEHDDTRYEATQNLTLLQTIKLCFHGDFLADPDNPVSLHLSGHPRRVIQYRSPIRLPLPAIFHPQDRRHPPVDTLP